jgi:hypothetical protein
MSTETVNYPTDCLVLRIDEFDSDSHKLDTSMYVFYDMNEEMYVIRGKRPDTWDTYSFYCDTMHDTMDFIRTVICKENLWSYTLYNFSNLSPDSDDITFGELEMNVRKEAEIVGYDYQQYNKKSLKRMLRILRNVYNYY